MTVNTPEETMCVSFFVHFLYWKSLVEVTVISLWSVSNSCGMVLQLKRVKVETQILFLSMAQLIVLVYTSRDSPILQYSLFLEILHPPPNFSAPYFFFFKQPSLQFPFIQSKLRQEPTEWGSLVRNHAVLTSSCFPQVLRGITTLAITNWCIAGNTLCSRCLRSELQIVHSTFCSTLRLLLLPYPNNTIKTAHTPGNL